MLRQWSRHATKGLPRRSSEDAGRREQPPELPNGTRPASIRGARRETGAAGTRIDSRAAAGQEIRTASRQSASNLCLYFCGRP